MFNFSYRSLSAEDSKDLSKLHASLFDRPLSKVDFEVYLKDADHKKSLGFGAFLEDYLVGFLLAYAIQGEGEILTLGVQKDFQKHGVAQNLLQRLIRAPEIITLFLEVNENNKAAISLYQKCGFKEISRREKYYKMPSGDFEDALILNYS